VERPALRLRRLQPVGGRDDVVFAAQNADGTLGDWTGAGSFQTARWNHTSVAYNGRLYVIGGYAGSNFADVQSATFNNDGTLGTFAPTTSLPGIRANHASTVYGGVVYTVGGVSDTLLPEVHLSRVGADGSLGAWTPTTALPAYRAYHTLNAHNGYLYVAGGWSNGHPDSEVLAAPILSDGTVGAWAETNVFGQSRYLHSSAVSNGRIYITGGDSGVAGTSYLNDVQVAALDPAGTVGEWTATTPFSGGAISSWLWATEASRTSSAAGTAPDWATFSSLRCSQAERSDRGARRRRLRRLVTCIPGSFGATGSMS